MVTFENDGSLTFRVYLPHAQSVALVADFTQWTAHAIPLEREGEPLPDNPLLHRAMDLDSLDYQLAARCGWWATNLTTEDGDHAFSYFIDRQWWLPDYAAHGVKRNEQGNWTSLLFVPPPPRIIERLSMRRSFDRTERMDPAAGLAESPSRLERVRAGKVA